ncbi:probable serine/threonine-protein kinase fhkB [Stomoxys calcitrans]|uniref:probable serine/threonine-protein kinase fhkB n=1 Tax=Stomoxys calcitrans TaxID=35570 RepID=UPI0027E2A400|nr:probable serine/threonine-protein kinase fhkB [Stomoxys calcitrans]XP_059216144.1 probable serine/threonine-protein kinase fhkB [Stomoxys calcitrans]
MANSYEPDTESDEDCEVYFLKPVNEYNIVDKIKEANKELFSQDVDGLANDDSNEKSDDLMSPLAGNRKVSFAANLEVYEPQSGISLQELEKKLGKEPYEPQEHNTEEGPAQKLEIITEEEAFNDTEEIEKPETPHSSSEKGNEDFPPAAEATEENMASASVEPADEAIEEICEEILVMDMENENATATKMTTKPPSSLSYESPGTQQRKMLKQITFDYDDEQDNKSLTNLLISDNEDETEDDDDDNGNKTHEEISLNDPDEHFDYNCNEPLLEDNETEENQHHSHRCHNSQANEEQPYNDDDDDEDDDKLSIIVASYLPDDAFDCDRASLTSDNKCSNHNHHHHHQSFRNRNKLPFRSRFSFKRRTNPSNVVGSSSCGGNNNNNRFLPPPEVTDLKLHYKTCCEFKNAQQKLPKYTGYLSEYGLSRDQLEEREQKLQHKQRSLLQQTLKTSEDEMRKMHDNERAFTKWLKNKMRFPINKTRNMFDVKRPFGLRKCTSVSGTMALTPPQQQHDVEGSVSEQHNIQIPHTTRYRSISAKLKKK